MNALSRVYGENIGVCGMSGRSVPTTWILRMQQSQPPVLCHPAGFILPSNQCRVKVSRRPGLWFAGCTDCSRATMLISWALKASGRREDNVNTTKWQNRRLDFELHLSTTGSEACPMRTFRGRQKIIQRWKWPAPLVSRGGRFAHVIVAIAACDVSRI